MEINVFVSNQFSFERPVQQPVVPEEIEPLVNVEQQHPVEEQNREEKTSLTNRMKNLIGNMFD